MKTSEHLDANCKPNPVNNVQLQLVQLTSPEMSECPVELARVRDDSCCRVEDTLQLVGRLPRSAAYVVVRCLAGVRRVRVWSQNG